jgi:HK97 family phage portal protein
MQIFPSWFFKKSNPAQSSMASEEGSRRTSNTLPYTTKRAYVGTEIVSRAVNLIVDSAAQVDYAVSDKLKFSPLASSSLRGGLTAEKLHELLNQRPNPYMDNSSFRRALWMDFVMEGWAFIHWDGSSMFHLPASHMEVFADPKAYINRFVYDSKTEFEPNEIIFIRDNSYDVAVNQMAGQSRIVPALESVLRRDELMRFKQNFFKNGTLFSLVVETDAVLSKRLKERFQNEVKFDYNPQTGKSSVLVLDGGMKAKTLTPTSTKDLDIATDVAELEKNILVALGIPPLLLDSGNNANIRPNIDLFFYMTILPAARKFESAFQLFFAHKLTLETDGIAALTPDKVSEATAVASKVNNGVITGNEGRVELRYEKLDDPEMDKIRIPANISGSATGVAGEEGGAPKKGTSEET